MTRTVAALIVTTLPLLAAPDGQMADVFRRAVAARAGQEPCWWNPDPDA